MSKRIAGPEIERLIQLLAKVPGLGPRSARRAALHLIKKKEQLLAPLASAMGEALEKVRICSTCGNVDTSDPCMICTDARRDPSTIIVVEDVADLWALERAGVDERAVSRARRHPFAARRHRAGPAEHQGVSSTGSRPAGVTEIIIAVNATVEGQTTAHYLTDQLADFGVKVTRLAHGVPVGGELDYLDEGTLSAALKSRTAF